MTRARQEFGKSGEDLAVAALEARGYEILARRYRTRCGEIDVVARNDETLVFVEVKARTTSEFGTAAEAITRRKRRKLARMAADYLARNEMVGCRCRFDVVAIDGAWPDPAVTVYPCAFTLTE